MLCEGSQMNLIWINRIGSLTEHRTIVHYIYPIVKPFQSSLHYKCQCEGVFYPKQSVPEGYTLQELGFLNCRQ
jgi:hypothetical protein